MSSILSVASSLLLRKTPYWAFNAVSNPESMASVWVTDVSDNVGRTVTGYQRGGKIEALRWGILTWTTGVVWGFGVPGISWAWNKAIPALTRYIDAAPDKREWLKSIVPSYGVKYANLQESLFKTHSSNADIYHVITAKNAQIFAKAEAKQIEKLARTLPPNIASTVLQQAKASSQELFAHIQSAFDASGNLIKLDASGNPIKGALVNTYSHNGGLRTFNSAVIPAVLVGVVLPLVIQVLQRGWIRDEKAHKAAIELKAAQEKQVAAVVARWKQNNPSGHATKLSRSLNKNALFGGNLLAPLFNTLRNSDIATTLLVDGVISGGRVVTALNGLDALENFLEETGVIAFLFVFRKKIQYGLEGFFSKGTNFLQRGKALLASLETPQIKWLIEKMHLNSYKLHQLGDATINTEGATEFINQLKAFKANFAHPDKINLNDYKPHWLEKVMGMDLSDKLLSKLGLKHAQNDVKLTEWKKVLYEDNGLRNYLEAGRTDNWFFELAKAEGYIPQKTVFTAPKGMAKEAAKALESHMMWDWTQNIKYDRMHALAKTLSDFADRTNITGNSAINHWSETELKNIAKQVRNSMGGKGIAFLVSLIISSAFIGWIIPKGRQYVTYLVSGSHQYPGALKDGQR